MKAIRKRWRASALIVCCALTLGISSIDPVNKFSWAENVGWLNWRDANCTNQGVEHHGTYLSGYIWGENIGWIDVGQGGAPYVNTNNTNYGVNVLGGGNLAGYAWGENIGWVDFAGGALAAPPQPARLDVAASRFRGYAWGENIGWMNLDDANHYVAILCYANCDQSTTAPVLNVNDFTCFLGKYAAGDAGANCDRSRIAPVVNVNDFTCFLAAYAAGCP